MDLKPVRWRGILSGGCGECGGFRGHEDGGGYGNIQLLAKQKPLVHSFVANINEHKIKLILVQASFVAYTMDQESVL